MKMHVFLYEWVTGGGLMEQPGRLPGSLVSEGSAMISALAADFAALEGRRVTVLRDLRLGELSLRRCEIVEVQSTADWREEFDRLAAAAEWSMIVAPEFDGILRDALRRAREAGGRLLNADDEFVIVASDKQRTADRLAAAGVATPEAVLIEPEEVKLPQEFPYPAVLKPLDGAGSQHTYLVTGPHDELPAYPWSRRLERYCPGRSASVAALCGPAGRRMLPPCWQRLANDGRFTYEGGGVIVVPELARRATALATQALAAMPPALGFVGVDLILGSDPDGGEDIAIEINPRLTTSYVGLRRAVKQNLAQAMLDVVEGREIELSMRAEPVEFAADGTVWNA
jgi:predicted ATP-grasp superfamily ATP-dependent carboligase